MRPSKRLWLRGQIWHTLCFAFWGCELEADSPIAEKLYESSEAM